MTETTSPWWAEPFRMFQTNLREVDSDLDVEAALDAIEDQAANVWLIGAGGIVSHYPTDLEFQRRSSRLKHRTSGDLVGDALGAARARDIKLLARFDFSKIEAEIAERHPEWAFVDADGERQVYNGLVSMCPAAGYVQQGAFEILREFLGRYRVDGLFFNMMIFPIFDYSYRWRGACFCSTCRERFYEFSGGLSIPTDRESEDFDVWLAYSAHVLGDLDRRFRELISELAPQAAFLRGPHAAIAFHEANNAVGRAFWPFETAQVVSALRSRAEAQPLVINSVAFLDMVYRFASEEPERFVQYTIQTLSRGGNPSVYIMGAPGGAVDYESVTASQEIFRFHRDNAEAYRRTRPAAQVAVVRIQPTLLQRVTTLFLGGPDRSTSDAEYRGWYSALQQAHVPFDVVALGDVLGLAVAEELTRYDAIILPDLGVLPQPVADSLDAYVRAGGRVIATGTSGVNGGEVQMASMPASTALETVIDTESLRNSYAGPLQPTMSDRGPYAGPLLPLIGSRTRFGWKADASLEGQIVSSAPFGPPEKCFGNIPLDEPSYAVGKAGEGVLFQVAWTPGASFTRTALKAVRDFMVGLVDQTLDARVIHTDLPDSAEVTLLRNDTGLLVHIVNHTGIGYNGFGSPVPLRRPHLAIRLTDAVSARALVSGTEVRTVVENGYLRLELGDIERFEAIQIVVDRSMPRASSSVG